MCLERVRERGPGSESKRNIGFDWCNEPGKHHGWIKKIQKERAECGSLESLLNNATQRTVRPAPGLDGLVLLVTKTHCWKRVLCLPPVLYWFYYDDVKGCLSAISGLVRFLHPTVRPAPWLDGLVLLVTKTRWTDTRKKERPKLPRGYY